jgi:surface polysaccharide O-acyltransferase-like enzyme
MNEGVIIQVIHTGKTSKDLIFTGTIIDVGKPMFIEQYDKFDQIFGPFLVALMPFAFVLYMFSGFFVGMVEKNNMIGWFLILVLVIGSVNTLVAYTKRIIPKKFRSILNEEI